MLKYSLVVPIYKDAELAEEFCLEFQRVFADFLSTREIERSVELIFVSDGGRNEDEVILHSICAEFSFAKAIILSRNFGQHIAITAGYKFAQGEYVGMLNVDQQDPVSELPKFLNHIAQNRLDIVYGLRESRESSYFDRLTSMLFNIFLNKLTGSQTPLNISTMRVMSRRFTDAYNDLRERERFLPGLEHWLGFDVGYVPTVHVERKRGVSAYTFRKRLNMAANSVLSFSDYPLQLIASFGFALSFFGFLSVIAIVIMKFFITFQAGYVSMISAIVFFSGNIIFAVGFTSLYIGKILKEVQGRPTYVIKEKVKLS